MDGDTFLAGVKASVAAQRLADPGSEPAAAGTGAAPDLASRFRANLETLSGIVHEPDGMDEAASIVSNLMRATGAGWFLSWDPHLLPIPGILDTLAATGLQRRSDAVPTDVTGRRRHQLGYYDCAVGLTGADAGLAESGSVIVASGPGRARMASLIPQIHIAVLRRELLWPSLSDWIADHPDALATAANWTVITGPSRTADIEMVITRGVHGPRDIHVVIV